MCGVVCKPGAQSALPDASNDNSQWSARDARYTRGRLPDGGLPLHRQEKGLQGEDQVCSNARAEQQRLFHPISS